MDTYGSDNPQLKGMDMIIPEWKRILEGKEPFDDPEVETVANVLMQKIKQASLNNDKASLIDLYNDLEELMGKGEWTTRSLNKMRMKLKQPLVFEDISHIQRRLINLKQFRDEVVTKIRSKYQI